MAGGGGQQGASAPAQGQGAAQPQGGGMPQQQQPQVNPQTIQDVQNLIQQYQKAHLGAMPRGFADGGFTQPMGQAAGGQSAPSNFGSSAFGSSVQSGQSGMNAASAPASTTNPYASSLGQAASGYGQAAQGTTGFTNPTPYQAPQGVDRAWNGGPPPNWTPSMGYPGDPGYSGPTNQGVEPFNPAPQGQATAGYGQAQMPMDARILYDGTSVGRNDSRFFDQPPSTAGYANLTPEQQARIAYNQNQAAYNQPLLQTPSLQTFDDLSVQGSTGPQYRELPAPSGRNGGLNSAAQSQQALTFSPQSPMGAYPEQPRGGGPDVTGNSSAADMGYDRSGSDAGIGGNPVLGVQSPLSLSQLRPQTGGLQIQGNPTSRPVLRMGRRVA